MTEAGEIWLGDLARSLRRLRAEESAARQAVARILRFDLPSPRIGDDPTIPPPDDPTDGTAGQAGAGEGEAEATGALLPADTSASIPVTLSPVRTELPPARADWRQAAPLEPFTPTHVAPVLPFEPLFERRRAPALIAAAAANPLPLGPFDVEKLVAMAARARPFVHLPRLRRWSLSHGTQLLIDMGSAMEPFSRDQLELASAVKRVVGTARVEELGFYDCPIRGVIGGDGAPRDYRPPDTYVPAVVLTDLGIGGPSDHVGRSRLSEWFEFAARLTRRDSRAVVLVPYPAPRWPRPLPNGLRLVHWDRSTTVSQVLQAVREAPDTR